jgi:hypothetical protein
MREGLRIFGELAGADSKVPGEKLKDALVSNGFSQDDVAAIIMNLEMAEDGIEEVSWHLEGLSYPTYRMKGDNQQ